MEVFEDRFIEIKRYSFDQDDDIFKVILEQRKNNPDPKRFFLEFLPPEEFSKYNFDNPNSADEFRSLCGTMFDCPLMKMGGYNMAPNHLSDDIRWAGIKMSDPYGKICGSFDIREGIITYSPIFPHFYEERDLIKFANDTYFTTMTFEEIMMQQIDRAVEFYVHTGNYRALKDIIKNGSYILEKVSKDQMIEFVSNPQEGAKILKKTI